MKHGEKLGIIVGSLVIIALGVVATRAVRAQSTAVIADVESPAIMAAATTPATPTTPTDRHQQKLDAMAQTLGMSSTDLQTEMNSGKPFYQIAAEHGMTYDKLKAQRDVKYKARLDDMVKVGYLTQAEADAALQQYQTNSQQMPMMGFGHMGMGGRMMHDEF